MKLTEARILYLARESLERMRSEGLIEVRNFAMALRHARELISEFIASGDQVDISVRRKIASLKRGVVEGSAEWQVLYRRYREEELRKKRPQAPKSPPR